MEVSIIIDFFNYVTYHTPDIRYVMLEEYGVGLLILCCPDSCDVA